VAGSASFEIPPPGRLADPAIADPVGPGEELPMDRVMAGLAAAFALDIDLVNAADGERRKMAARPHFWFVS